MQFTCHADRQLNVPIFPKGADGAPRDFNSGCVAEASDGGVAPRVTGPETDPDGRIRYNLHIPPLSADTDASTGITRTVQFGDGDGFPGDTIDVLFVHPDATSIDVGAPTEEPIG